MRASIILPLLATVVLATPAARPFPQVSYGEVEGTGDEPLDPVPGPVPDNGGTPEDPTYQGNNTAALGGNSTAALDLTFDVTGIEDREQCQASVYTDDCQFGSTLVKEGDTCQSIGRDFSVSQVELVRINGLSEGCVDLPLGEEICLPAVCKLYEVVSGDTCIVIAEKFGSSLSNFRSNNPGINTECTNLILGEDVCLTSPGYL